MVQTELNIGSGFKPHYQETWEIINSITTHQRIGGQDLPFTNTHHIYSSPGKYGCKYSTYPIIPDEPYTYDTGVSISGVEISIQDECGVYPTMTVHPQDGSKYHLDITGNHTASTDINKETSYNMHCESAVNDTDWNIEWSMSDDYFMNIKADYTPSASAFFSGKVSIYQNNELIQQTTIDTRTNNIVRQKMNGIDVVVYDYETDTLYGYDNNGDVDFQSKLIPTGYYSGSGDDYRTRYGAFMPTNYPGFNISVKRRGLDLDINISDNSRTTYIRFLTYMYSGGVQVGQSYDQMVSGFLWPTTDVVSSGILLDNTPVIYGIGGFWAANYRETAGGVRKQVVFDMYYRPDGETVTINGSPVIFKLDYNSSEYYYTISCYTNIQQNQGDSDSDSDSDSDDEVAVPLDDDTDTDNDLDA